MAAYASALLKRYNKFPFSDQSCVLNTKTALLDAKLSHGEPHEKHVPLQKAH